MLYDNFQQNNEIISPMIMVIVVSVLVILFYYVSTTTASRSSSKPRLTVEELGKAAWTVLHSNVANYPDVADNDTQRKMNDYINLFARFYPCKKCASHMIEYVSRNRPIVTDKTSLQKWMCVFHNSVNKKLQKKEQNCDNIRLLDQLWKLDHVDETTTSTSSCSCFTKRQT